MSIKKIDYLALVNDAMISVVKQILQLVATQGLYQKQHLYIKFATQHPGVKISEILHDDFMEEMTIILQYEFWDLVVDEYGFAVSLAFEHDDETLYVPFSAILSISDPSEDFSIDLFPNFSDDPNLENSQQEQPSNIINFETILKKRDQ